MGKLAYPRKLSRSDFSDAPDWFVDRFLVTDNERTAQVFDVLMRNVSFQDNMRSQTIDYKFTHNVEVVFLAEFSGKPFAVIPVFAEEGQFIPSVKVSLKQPIKPADPKTQIGLTAFFVGAPTTPIQTRILMFW